MAVSKPSAESKFPAAGSTGDRRTVAGANVSISLDFHFDGLRAVVLGFRHAEREHAVLVFGRHVIRLGVFRQGEAPFERAVSPLDAVILLTLLFLFQMALPADLQDSVLYEDFDILFLDVRQLRLDDEFLVILGGGFGLAAGDGLKRQVPLIRTCGSDDGFVNFHRSGVACWNC